MDAQCPERLIWAIFSSVEFIRCQRGLFFFVGCGAAFQRLSDGNRLIPLRLHCGTAARIAA
jgi:hypothetical protein